MSNEQETKSQSSLDNCTAIVVDVAGTTTSIKFVEDTLFPFVKEHVAEFLKANWDENHVKDAVKLLKKSDDDKTETPTLDETVELIKTLTEKQDSNSGLKTIQGLIYKNGYENGKLKGHVFDDVPGSFEAWSKLGKKIAIYSTGSVESQTLLFSHTRNGDLTKFITKYYDQSVIGTKTDTESYQKIAKDLDMKTNQIVFVSDNLLEIKAAKSAGFNVFLIHRDGNEKLPETEKEFTTITSFKDVSFETTTKRKSDDKGTTVEEEPPSKIPKTDTTEKSENTTTDKDKDKDELKEDKVEKMVEDEIVNEDKKTDEKIETDSDKTVVDKKQCDNKETAAENSEKQDESTKTVDDKKDEKSATIEEEKTSETVVAEENKDKTTTEDKENGETTTTTTTTIEENAKNETTEEKENKNVLANGVENKDDNNMEVVDEQPPVVEISKDKDETKTNDDNETTITTTTKTDEENTETTPVKKLDETTKSPAAVSVEV